MHTQTEKNTQFFQSKKYKFRNSLQSQLRLLKMIERCGLITRTTIGGLEIWGKQNVEVLYYLDRWD